MGAMGDLLGMIPGMKKLTKGMDMSAAETELKHIEAIINSMTSEERDNAADPQRQPAPAHRRRQRHDRRRRQSISSSSSSRPRK